MKLEKQVGLVDTWTYFSRNFQIFVTENEHSILYTSDRFRFGEELQSLARQVSNENLKVFKNLALSENEYKFVCIERGGLYVTPSESEMRALFGYKRPVINIDMKREENPRKTGRWCAKIHNGIENLLNGCRSGEVLVVCESCSASGSTMIGLLTTLKKFRRLPSRLVLMTPVVGSLAIKRLRKLCRILKVELTVVTNGLWWVQKKGIDSGLPETDFVINESEMQNSASADILHFVPPKTLEAYRRAFMGRPVCCVGDIGDRMAVSSNNLSIMIHNTWESLYRSGMKELAIEFACSATH